jgi:hypothetical protein
VSFIASKMRVKVVDFTVEGTGGRVISPNIWKPTEKDFSFSVKTTPFRVETMLSALIPKRR